MWSGQMVTANRLSDGIVVFLGEAGWVETLEGASLLKDTATVAQALARAKADEARDMIVDPYAIEIIEKNGGPGAKHLREAIRAAGPTIRLDLGKQAELAA